MRFPKETLVMVYEAAPGICTIDWPAGAKEPRRKRAYWMQRELPKPEPKPKEKKEKPKLPEKVDTHAEVMAVMRAAWYGESEVQLPKSRRRRESVRRPRIDTPRLIVEAVIIEPIGWKAVVRLETDPVRWNRVEATQPGGPSRFEDARPDPTELEPEQIRAEYQERLSRESDQSVALQRAFHKQRAATMRAERHVAKERRNGKPGILAAAAAERSAGRMAGPESGAAAA